MRAVRSVQNCSTVDPLVASNILVDAIKEEELETIHTITHSPMTELNRVSNEIDVIKERIGTTDVMKETLNKQLVEVSYLGTQLRNILSDRESKEKTLKEQFSHLSCWIDANSDRRATNNVAATLLGPSSVSQLLEGTATIDDAKDDDEILYSIFSTNVPVDIDQSAEANSGSKPPPASCYNGDAEDEDVGRSVRQSKDKIYGPSE